MEKIKNLIEKKFEFRLNERQKKAIELLKKFGKITTTQCADLLNVSNDTAFRELSKLMSIDLIKKKVLAEVFIMLSNKMPDNAVQMRCKNWREKNN